MISIGIQRASDSLRLLKQSTRSAWKWNLSQVHLLFLRVTTRKTPFFLVLCSVSNGAESAEHVIDRPTGKKVSNRRISASGRWDELPADRWLSSWTFFFFFSTHHFPPAPSRSPARRRHSARSFTPFLSAAETSSPNRRRQFYILLNCPSFSLCVPFVSPLHTRLSRDSFSLFSLTRPFYFCRIFPLLKGTQAAFASKGLAAGGANLRAGAI